jgi:hypothetical protein
MCDCSFDFSSTKSTNQNEKFSKKSMFKFIKSEKKAKIRMWDTRRNSPRILFQDY